MKERLIEETITISQDIRISYNNLEAREEVINEILDNTNWISISDGNKSPKVWFAGKTKNIKLLKSNRKIMKKKEILELRPEFKLNGGMTMVDWFEITESGSFFSINSGLKHADGVTKSPYHYSSWSHGIHDKKKVLRHFTEWWNNLDKSKN